MKKVVHLTSAHSRYDDRILWRECRSLCERGYDVTLIVNDAQENETLDSGIKILSTGFVPRGRRQRMTTGVSKVYELGVAQDADVYHLHDPELLRIALRLKQKRKKVIFDSHEFYGEQIKSREYIPTIVRSFIAGSYHVYETYVCKRLDGVIVPALYDGKETFSGRAKRIAHVNNCPRRSEYGTTTIPAYAERKGVCYSGGLSENRGITNLVEAGKKAGAKILLAGRFSSTAYEKQILDGASSDEVEYIGYINSREDVFSFYAHCAIGVGLLIDDGQYGKMEGLPTKVYEYMAAEMPVLISDFPYNRKIIEKHRFGLVANPTDVEDIAAKTTWLLEHPKEAEEMGKNGKRLLEEQFTWERAAEPELFSLYQEVEQD